MWNFTLLPYEASICDDCKECSWWKKIKLQPKATLMRSTDEMKKKNPDISLIFFNGQQLRGKFTVAYCAAYYEGSHKWIMLTGWKMEIFKLLKAWQMVSTTGLWWYLNDKLLLLVNYHWFCCVIFTPSVSNKGKQLLRKAWVVIYKACY